MDPTWSGAGARGGWESVSRGISASAWPARRGASERRAGRAATAARTHLGVLEEARVVDDVLVHRREPKIGELCVVLGVEQDILGLQVTVEDAVAVAVAEREQDLHKVPPRLLLDEAAALGDAVEELAALRRVGAVGEGEEAGGGEEGGGGGEEGEEAERPSGAGGGSWACV